MSSIFIAVWQRLCGKSKKCFVDYKIFRLKYDKSPLAHENKAIMRIHSQATISKNKTIKMKSNSTFVVDRMSLIQRFLRLCRQFSFFFDIVNLSTHYTIESLNMNHLNVAEVFVEFQWPFMKACEIDPDTQMLIFHIGFVVIVHRILDTSYTLVQRP